MSNREKVKYNSGIWNIVIFFSYRHLSSMLSSFNPLSKSWQLKVHPQAFTQLCLSQYRNVDIIFTGSCTVLTLRCCAEISSFLILTFNIILSLSFLMIYLLTAIGLTPGGSNTIHIYTEQHNETEDPEQNIYNNS